MIFLTHKIYFGAYKIFRFLNNFSVKNKLLISISAMVLIMPLILVSYFQYRFLNYNLGQIHKESLHSAKLLAYSVKSALDFNDYDAVKKILDGASSNPDVEFVIVYTADSLEYARYVKKGKEQHIPSEPNFNRKNVQRDNLLLVPVKIMNNHNATLGYLLLGAGMGEINNQVMDNFITLGLWLTVILIATLLLTFALSSYITLPLSQLTDVAARIGKGDLDHKINIQNKDEIGFLAQKFNEMADRLKASRQEVDKYTNQLQQLVKERTSELEKRNEELELQTKRAEQASKLKSEFLANMSHEIRTPMNAIMGMTHLLLETKLSDDQKELAKIINFSSESLLRIINDIIDISKIEVGRIEILTSDFNLHKLLNETKKLFEKEALRKGITLDLEIEKSVPVLVNSDMTRIKQILINLINNAIKFTQQGSVKIKAKRWADLGEQAKICFDIIDTGIGIAPDKHQLIFKSFTQADGSTARKYGGTGLGLSISAQLVKLLGGKIGLNSTLDKGSHFWFDILVTPLHLEIEHKQKEDSTVYPQKELSESAGLNQNILIAEDNPINQKLIKRFVERLGHIPIVVSNGREVIKALENNNFKIILMDIQMPEIDGYEATRIIRSQAKYSHLPIVALTANAMEGDRQKCIEAGMDDYLSKPVSYDDFKEVINKWLTTQHAHHI